VAKTRSDLLHGTLELLVLRILENEAMNGYGIGRRIEDLTGDALSVDEGSLYPALYRMEGRAKFYRLTRAGRRRLGSERRNWTEFTSAVKKILESA
jgi:PadR family transcriptional regulator PadR